MATDVLTGIAASAAAVFSGVTLALGPGRERRKWVRETGLDAYSTFFNASYDAGTACRKGRDALASGEDPTPYRDQAQAGHVLRNAMRSRLRLLAPKKVVAAMTAVHEADDLILELAFQSPACSEVTWNEVRASRKAARAAFVRTVRRSLHISDGGDADL